MKYKVSLVQNEIKINLQQLSKDKNGLWMNNTWISNIVGRLVYRFQHYVHIKDEWQLCLHRGAIFKNDG